MVDHDGPHEAQRRVILSLTVRAVVNSGLILVDRVELNWMANRPAAVILTGRDLLANAVRVRVQAVGKPTVNLRLAVVSVDPELHDKLWRAVGLAAAVDRLDVELDGI